jgi:quinol-cytochrome oxidoreductase complex cytochrome b subunit
MRSLRKPAMFKNFLLGLLAVWLVIQIASAGYQFGQYLAQAEPAAASTPAER